ncbi:hypothetical protein ACWDZW_06475 [Streptomyces coeruleorubidus]
MAKNLSAAEAFALAKLAASRASGELSVVAELVRSQLSDDPQASRALEVAEENPQDVQAISRLAAYLRTYGRSKDFRSKVRSTLGSRKKVAAIGVAQLVAAFEAEQRPPRLTRTISSRLTHDPDARETLNTAQAQPDDLESILSLAEQVRSHVPEVRSLQGVPISDPFNGGRPLSADRLKGTLPQFANIVTREAGGIPLEPRAEQMVRHYLRKGSEAVRSTPPEDREQLIADSVEQLHQTTRSAVQRVQEINASERQNEPVVVDAALLTEVIGRQGTCPPFL